MKKLLLILCVACLISTILISCGATPEKNDKAILKTEVSLTPFQESVSTIYLETQKSKKTNLTPFQKGVSTYDHGKFVVHTTEKITTEKPTTTAVQGKNAFVLVCETYKKLIKQQNVKNKKYLFKYKYLTQNQDKFEVYCTKKNRDNPISMIVFNYIVSNDLIILSFVSPPYKNIKLNKIIINYLFASVANVRNYDIQKYGNITEDENAYNSTISNNGFVMHKGIKNKKEYINSVQIKLNKTLFF